MRSTTPEDPTLADAVPDRLRAAAEAASPAFSPALHAAVMRAVRREATTGPSVRRTRFGRVVGAAAAAAAVLVGVRLLRPAPPGSTVEVAKAMPLPGLPPSPRELVGRVDPLARRWVDGQRDEWDRTAHRLGRFCLGRLDVFPTPADRRPAGNSSLPS